MPNRDRLATVRSGNTTKNVMVGSCLRGIPRRIRLSAPARKDISYPETLANPIGLAGARNDPTGMTLYDWLGLGGVESVLNETVWPQVDRVGCYDPHISIDTATTTPLI